MIVPTIFDSRICRLGEGPLWHPLREQLFWFDITNHKLLTRTSRGDAEISFGECVSAAGWVDENSLLIASEKALTLFDIESGAREIVCELEPSNRLTRSNDGRADPWGGFWIGTMGKRAEKNAGAIYRYYRGELRQLLAPLTIPNAISFAPDASCAYFADTAQGYIWKQPLSEKNGWPNGEPEIFIDCRAMGVNPDGAVVDSSGQLWNAQWGASRVACYDMRGRFVKAIGFPTSHVSCPAFGGADLSTLFVTSATQELPETVISSEPDAGKTWIADAEVCGQREYRVEI
jgi:sugar lactone lactonase YvrE